MDPQRCADLVDQVRREHPKLTVTAVLDQPTGDAVLMVEDKNDTKNGVPWTFTMNTVDSDHLDLLNKQLRDR